MTEFYKMITLQEKESGKYKIGLNSLDNQRIVYNTKNSIHYYFLGPEHIFLCEVKPRAGDRFYFEHDGDHYADILEILTMRDVSKVSTFEFMREKGIKISGMTWIGVAKRGYFDVIQWLFKNGYSSFLYHSIDVCEMCWLFKHYHIISWIHENKYCDCDIP